MMSRSCLSFNTYKKNTCINEISVLGSPNIIGLLNILHTAHPWHVLNVSLFYIAKVILGLTLMGQYHKFSTYGIET